MRRDSGVEGVSSVEGMEGGEDQAGDLQVSVKGGSGMFLGRE